MVVSIQNSNRLNKNESFEFVYIETLAMKGLILNFMGKKDEGLENIRNGIKNNITSHIVWHAFGQWQRSDGKYDEAVKAYKKALELDKMNQVNKILKKNLLLNQFSLIRIV